MIFNWLVVRTVAKCGLSVCALLYTISGCSSRIEETRTTSTPDVPRKPRTLVDASTGGRGAGADSGRIPTARLDAAASTGRDSDDGPPDEPAETEASTTTKAAQTCRMFQDIWAIRRENLADDPTLGGTCFACVFYTDCVTPSSCDSGSACVERNCLCTSEVTGCRAETYPKDLCSCVESCFEQGSACVAAWDQYMKCVNKTCEPKCLD